MPSSPPLGKSSENLKALGWVERMLPNEMTYFQHKGLAITTNSNLHGVQDVTNLSSSLSNEATIFRSKFPLLEWELWVPELPLRREKVLLVNHTLCLAMREQSSLEIFSVGDLSNDDSTFLIVPKLQHVFMRPNSTRSGMSILALCKDAPSAYRTLAANRRNCDIDLEVGIWRSAYSLCITGVMDSS